MTFLNMIYLIPGSIFRQGEQPDRVAGECDSEHQARPKVYQELAPTHTSCHTDTGIKTLTARGLCAQGSCDTRPTFTSMGLVGLRQRDGCDSVSASEGMSVVHTGRGTVRPVIHTAMGAVPVVGHCTVQSEIEQGACFEEI